MAGDWIKMRTDLHTDPRVGRISSLLKCNSLVTVGALHKLWSLGDTHTADGLFVGIDAEWIDAQVGLPGLADALQDEFVRWLVVTENGLQLPDFDRHNGKSGKARALGQKRVDALRKRNAPIVTSQLPEKRREEYTPLPPKPDGEPISLADVITAIGLKGGAVNKLKGMEDLTAGTLIVETIKAMTDCDKGDVRSWQAVLPSRLADAKRQRATPRAVLRLLKAISKNGKATLGEVVIEDVEKLGYNEAGVNYGDVRILDAARIKKL